MCCSCESRGKERRKRQRKERKGKEKRRKRNYTDLFWSFWSFGFSVNPKPLTLWTFNLQRLDRGALSWVFGQFFSCPKCLKQLPSNGDVWESAGTEGQERGESGLLVMRQWYAGSPQAVTQAEGWACSLTDDDDESHRHAVFSSPTLSPWSSSVFRGRHWSSSLSEQSADVCKVSGRGDNLNVLRTFIWCEVNTRVRSYMCRCCPPDLELPRLSEVACEGSFLLLNALHRPAALTLPLNELPSCGLIN